MNKKLAFLMGLLALSVATGGKAAPLLKAEVTVVSEIVTVGDMFEGAGPLAERALFRAPRPGTAGMVSLDAVRGAAALVGLTEFANDGVTRVRVARAGSPVDASLLSELIAADLRARGIADSEVTVRVAFDTPDPTFVAEAVPTPVQLLSLRYLSGSQAFSARFLISGSDSPVDLTGRVDLLIAAPHLAATRPAGTILQPADIEMRLVPLRFAETMGIPAIGQLVGKQLERQGHSGLILKASDVCDPLVVQRNALVTVYLRSGPMTLSVKGQALNSASVGQPVQVLNPVSRKILHGVAMQNGSVGVSSTLTLAGLEAEE